MARTWHDAGTDGAGNEGIGMKYFNDRIEMVAFYFEEKNKKP